ncbi:MAG: hypothetical protein ACTSQD_03970 [Promethearchaeota archaeon]
MIKQLYQSLLEAGFSEKEIFDKLKKKNDEYQGFMSKEAILVLIAKESGLNVKLSDTDIDIYGISDDEVDYDEFKIAISNITEETSNIVILGRIGKIFNVSEFHRKDGTRGNVGSFIIYDNSGSIKVVLWGEHVKIMNETYFQTNELIRLIGGYSKIGLRNKLEVHLGKNSKILLSTEEIDQKQVLVKEKSSEISKAEKIVIKDLNNEDIRDTFVAQVTGTVDKLEFKEQEKKGGDIRFLLKFVLYDNISSIGVVVWGLKAIKLLKLINEGDSIILSNFLVKYNTYSKVNEIHLLKNSKLICI